MNFSRILSFCRSFYPVCIADFLPQKALESVSLVNKRIKFKMFINGKLLGKQQEVAKIPDILFLCQSALVYVQSNRWSHLVWQQVFVFVTNFVFNLSY